jgi:hypothetical protein
VPGTTIYHQNVFSLAVQGVPRLRRHLSFLFAVKRVGST